MVTSEEEFSRYHKRLRDELNKANWHFSIVKYISDIGKDYHKELNQAPGFWGLTINAHMSCALARLNNFFGEEKVMKHLHMRSFLDFIEQNLGIFSNQAFKKRLCKEGRYDELAAKFNSEITIEKVKSDRQKLSKLPISSLTKWRNKILSHIDKNYVARNVDITKRYPIQMKHIEQIIDTLDDMLNEYSLAYDFSTYNKGLAIEDGIKYILDAVRFKLQS